MVKRRRPPTTQARFSILSKCAAMQVRFPIQIDSRTDSAGIRLRTWLALEKPGKVNRQRRGSRVERRRGLIPGFLTEPFQHIAEQRPFGLEIETVQGVVIEESSLDGRGSFEQGCSMAA